MESEAHKKMNGLPGTSSKIGELSIFTITAHMNMRFGFHYMLLELIGTFLVYLFQWTTTRIWLIAYAIEKKKLSNLPASFESATIFLSPAAICASALNSKLFPPLWQRKWGRKYWCLRNVASPMKKEGRRRWQQWWYFSFVTRWKGTENMRYAKNFLRSTFSSEIHNMGSWD